LEISENLTRKVDSNTTASGVAQPSLVLVFIGRDRDAVRE